MESSLADLLPTPPSPPSPPSASSSPSLPPLSPTRSSVAAPAETADELQVGEEPIRVLVRVRPLDNPGREVSQPALLQVEAADTVRVTRSGGGSGHSARQSELRVRFDSVLNTEASQAIAFRHVAPAVESALGGLNSTVFAYGQTGSGKTHTLFGGMLPGEPPLDSADGAEPSALEGMASRALRHIFARAEAAAAAGLRLAVTCSFLEVYNEHITDLLLPAGSRTAWGGGAGAADSLSLREDPNWGEVRVHGLSEVPIHTVGQALALVRRALRGRAVRQTDMNSRSSRSHAVLQLLLEQAPGGGLAAGSGKKAMRARLNLVDLAGSERVQSGAEGVPDLTHVHKREMGHINKSLSALANCISALAKPNRTHVPYRDSVLTRLLQASLGGNSRTLLIATVSPADKCVDESLSTLRFADRAKHVMLRATVNPTDIGETLVQQRRRFEARIDRLQTEVLRLRDLLESRNASSMQPSGLSLDAATAAAAAQLRIERERTMRRLSGDGEDASAVGSTTMELIEENERLRSMLAQRDAELIAERAERERLQAIVNGRAAAPPQAAWGEAEKASAGAGAAARRGQRGGAPPAPPSRGNARDEEADGLLKEVMDELRLQETELERIRSEEREIEALLRRSQGAHASPRAKEYGGGGLPGGGAYGGAAIGSGRGRLPEREPAPRHMPRDPVAYALTSNGQVESDNVGLAGSMPAAFSRGGGRDSPARMRGSWQPQAQVTGSMVPPPAFSQPSAGQPLSRGGRRAEASLRSDPSSMHYDARCDPNSRYYDPELDPNSKWYVGSQAHEGGAPPSGSTSWRSAQPASGSAWTGQAYGSAPPRSGGGGVPPRSPGPQEPTAPRGNPTPSGRRSGGRRNERRGNKSVGSVGVGSHVSVAAVSALGGTMPTDVGSLYYVLGPNASSSRVKQLQQMLHMRRAAEQSNALAAE